MYDGSLERPVPAGWSACATSPDAAVPPPASFGSKSGAASSQPTVPAKARADGNGGYYPKHHVPYLNVSRCSPQGGKTHNGHVSDRGGQRAAAMYSLIVTAKLNDVNPQAWLADVLARIAEHPARDIDELLPWNWRPRSAPRSQAA